MPTQQKQHFILSYSFSLEGQPFPLKTVVADVDECLTDFVRMLNLYSILRGTPTESAHLTTLFYLNKALENRLNDQIQWIDDIDLMVTDFEIIDDQQLSDIRKVKQLLGLDCITQNILLRRLKYDLIKTKSSNRFESIKNLFINDPADHLTPVEKAVIDIVLRNVESESNLDTDAIDAVIASHNKSESANTL